MNLRIESSSVLSGLPATDPFLLPIMWFEDSIEKIPETIHDMLKDALTSGSGIAFKIFVAIVDIPYHGSKNLHTRARPELVSERYRMALIIDVIF